ncbi:MlaC/ttg2D family ABC transporter substrate-binding protein [Desulfoplanes formicivorans]|uniref:Toluene tolerance family protein n=1 Tax=Desulfoplanes formicivorans TaxID=1592317 RepID=A0A194AF53_9BACT|nr:ABC transporter substrate-binding protein [Desulfoplanes formicivorans]GAU08697.1 toluene tolerance family protein [Desulfoplanes formicivorans]
MPRIFCILAFLLTLSTPLGAATGPMEHVKTHVEQALFILTDPQYKNEANLTKQEEMLVLVGEQLFDFNDVTRLAVGRYWKSFSSEQRHQFRDLFAQLLQKIYMDKVRAYKGEPVVFDKEIMLSSTKARVNTHILWNDKEVPLDYMLRFKHDQWRVYDVIVEGVSLVKNYRSQFSSILSKNPPDVLLEQVRKKIEQPADPS